VAQVWTDPDRGDEDTDQASLDPETLAQLTDFTFALRVAGLAVTIEQTMAFLRAVDCMSVRDGAAVHAAGRAHLCGEDSDIPLFDDTFTWFFAGSPLRQQRRRAPLRNSLSGHRSGFGAFRRV
jgi:uncharacterized protein with von Willebrand factor type A (vWA) domain